MRARIAFAVVVLGALAGSGAGAGTEQTVVPLTPPAEQRVQAIGDDQVQRVEPVDPAGDQAVAAHEPPSPAMKTASTVGKVVLGVTAAVVALGAMAASLLLL